MTKRTISIILTLGLSCFASISAFVQSKQRVLIKFELCAKQDDDVGPVVKASWYAVESFGKLFAPNKNKSQRSEIDQTIAPSSVEETLRRIEDDNARSYFLSGEVDKLIYSENCIFSDPFVAFEGRDRFVSNLSNLGSFISDYDAKMLDYKVLDDGLTVQTKVRIFSVFQVCSLCRSLGVGQAG